MWFREKPGQADALTAEGWKIFDATINWALADKPVNADRLNTESATSLPFSMSVSRDRLSVGIERQGHHAIDILAPNGQRIMCWSDNGPTVSVKETNHLAPGVYIARVRSADRRDITRAFTRQ